MTRLSALFLFLLLPLAAQSPKPVLPSFEKKLGIAFDIPFPADWDIDVYKKKPIALLPVEGGKVSFTQPIVNPYDDSGSIEWMVGPEQAGRFPQASIDIFLHLDEAGNFLQISLISSPDPWSAREGNSQLERNDSESGADFFKRALATYRERAAKAKDPAQAALFLSGFEKIARAIQNP